MRKTVSMLMILVFVASTIGCANGPIRRWFRGSACNTCNPPAMAPAGQNLIGNCNSGTCGTGVCNSDVCNTQGNGILPGLFGNRNNVAPPASLPASTFDQPLPGAASNDVYGNTINSGRMEIPPSNTFN